MAERIERRCEEDPTHIIDHEQGVDCKMNECNEESLYTVDSEGDHKQKTFLASCDRHRRVENGDQEVPCGDLMAEVVSKTDTWSSKPMPAPTEGDDENIDDGCLVSSDQIKFNLEPMCETYRSAVYAMRPEFEEKVLVKNIISKVHNNAGGFLSDREEDEVMAYRTNLDRMYSLLKILRTKSNKHFMTFYKALESSGYQHFATQLKKAAGINCKPPQGPGPEATHKILKERKVAYSLHSVIEKLKAPFSTVQGEFRKQVRSLSDDLYDEVVALCQTTMAAKAHKSRLPDVPSHRKDFIEHIIKHTTFFDIELIHEVANLLQQPTLTEAVVKYEADLEPLMRTSIGELTDRCEEMPIIQDSPEGTCRLMLKFPDDANIRDLYEAKDYLEKVLHIPDAKLLAFDFGCILAHFEITCAPDALKDLPKKFTKHSDQLKAMGISGAFLIDHWAWGADSNDVWYTDDESDDMEVNDQQGFLGNRKRSHLGSALGGCVEIVPSKKASQLKENCPTKKESGDRLEEDYCSQPPHPLMLYTEEATSQRFEPVFQTKDLKEELLHSIELLQTPLREREDERAQRESTNDGVKRTEDKDQVQSDDERELEDERARLKSTSRPLWFGAWISYYVCPCDYVKSTEDKDQVQSDDESVWEVYTNTEYTHLKLQSTSRPLRFGRWRSCRIRKLRELRAQRENLISQLLSQTEGQRRCKTPSDRGLYEVASQVQFTQNQRILAEKLGVTLFLHQHNPLINTLRRWRDGGGGKNHPPTWRCLLDALSRTPGVDPHVVRDLEEKAKCLTEFSLDGDCRETSSSDYHYQTNLRSSKVLKLSLTRKSSTQPVLRQLARKRKNRLKAISSSAQSLNCHHRKSQRTIRTSHTSHTSSLPCLAQPQTSSVQSDSTDEVESTRMDQTDSGFSNDQ